MPRKKKKASLPYKRFRIYFSKRTGKPVKAGSRVKKYYRYGYISLLTGSRIAADVKHKDRAIQGLREAFPGRKDKTLRKINNTIKEYKSLGFNPAEKSPGLLSYFNWVRKNKPKQIKNIEKTLGIKISEVPTKEEIAEFRAWKAAQAKARRRPRRKHGR